MDLVIAILSMLLVSGGFVYLIYKSVALAHGKRKARKMFSIAIFAGVVAIGALYLVNGAGVRPAEVEEQAG